MDFEFLLKNNKINKEKTQKIFELEEEPMEEREGKIDFLNLLPHNKSKKANNKTKEKKSKKTKEELLEDISGNSMKSGEGDEEKELLFKAEDAKIKTKKKKVKGKHQKTDDKHIKSSNINDFQLKNIEDMPKQDISSPEIKANLLDIPVLNHMNHISVNNSS